jgi:hypothetical protein
MMGRAVIWSKIFKWGLEFKIGCSFTCHQVLTEPWGEANTRSSLVLT